jgi:hypothetical protein
MTMKNFGLMWLNIACFLFVLMMLSALPFILPLFIFGIVVIIINGVALAFNAFAVFEKLEKFERMNR